MAAYLGVDIYTIATIDILIQTIAYLILIMGFLFARKQNFRRHGLFMGIATLLVFMSLFVVMLPAFYSLVSGISTERMQLPISISVIHHILGVTSLAMAVVAIVVLRPCGSVRGNKKLGNVLKYMRLLLTFWSITYFLGIVVYLMFYTAILSY